MAPLSEEEKAARRKLLEPLQGAKQELELECEKLNQQALAAQFQAIAVDGRAKCREALVERNQLLLQAHPRAWAVAMLAHPQLAAECTEADRNILKRVTDLKVQAQVANGKQIVRASLTLGPDSGLQEPVLWVETRTCQATGEMTVEVSGAKPTGSHGAQQAAQPGMKRKKKREFGLVNMFKTGLTAEQASALVGALIDVEEKAYELIFGEDEDEDEGDEGDGAAPDDDDDEDDDDDDDDGNDA